MRLSLEITRTPEGKHYFKVCDNMDFRNADIVGSGWTVRDALEDYFGQIRKDLFFDDDCPVCICRDDLQIVRRTIRLCCKKVRAVGIL